MKTEILSELNIHKFKTEAQYEAHKDSVLATDLCLVPEIELPLVSSEGDNSFSQSGYDNKAYATAGSALGYNTISGAKGFKIVENYAPGEESIDDTQNVILESGQYKVKVNNKVLFDDFISKTSSGNFEYSIFLKATADRVGKITSVEYDPLDSDYAFIFVKPYFHPNNWNSVPDESILDDAGNIITRGKDYYYDNSYIFCDSFPLVGDVLIGTSSHSEGYETKAVQIGSHSEGYGTTALGKYSHAEGDETTALYSAHSEGKLSQAIGYHSHAEGYQTVAEGQNSHSEGYGSKASGFGAHSEGNSLDASGEYSHAEGNQTIASGESSHSEGKETVASGASSHSEGWKNISSGQNSHTEGYNNEASGQYAHAEGAGGLASGQSAHSEGYGSKATNVSTHAEGYATEASGQYSHAEGFKSTASGNSSHSEGYQNTVSGDYGHVGGYLSTSSGAYSFAHGFKTEAQGRGSVALGREVIAKNEFQTVVGAFNDTSVNNAKFIVGVGSDDSHRRNGFVVYNDGRATLGASPVDPMDVTTKQYVDNKIEEDVIVILDVDRSNVEEIQELINDVEGTLVLNFDEDTFHNYSGIKIPETVHTVYMNGSAHYLVVEGPGKSSNTSIFLDTFYGTYTTVSGFKAVYNSINSAVYDIRDCETVSNCSVAAGFYNCDYVIQSEASDGADSNGYIDISGCKMVVDCKVVPGDMAPEVNIVNCAHINDFEIYLWGNSSNYDYYTATFRNCDSISDVYLVSNNSQDGINVEYIDCKNINNCYGATNTEIEDLNNSISNLSNSVNLIYPEIDNTTIDKFSNPGWYQIAKSPSSVHVCSSLFKIKAKTATGGNWVSAIFTAETCFGDLPRLTVLSHQYHNLNFIDAVRIRYPSNYNGNTASIELHVTTIENNPVEIVVTMLGDDIDNVPSWRNGWNLSIGSTSIDDLGTGMKAIEKSFGIYSLSNLDIKSIPTQSYIDNKLSNFKSGLNVQDSAEEGKYITSISQVDGKINAVKDYISSVDINPYTISFNCYGDYSAYEITGNVDRITIGISYISSDAWGEYVTYYEYKLDRSNRDSWVISGDNLDNEFFFKDNILIISHYNPYGDSIVEEFVTYECGDFDMNETSLPTNYQKVSILKDYSEDVTNLKESVDNISENIESINTDIESINNELLSEIDITINTDTDLNNRSANYLTVKSLEGDKSNLNIIPEGSIRTSDTTLTYVDDHDGDPFVEPETIVKTVSTYYKDGEVYPNLPDGTYSYTYTPCTGYCENVYIPSGTYVYDIRLGYLSMFENEEYIVFTNISTNEVLKLPYHNYWSGTVNIPTSGYYNITIESEYLETSADLGALDEYNHQPMYACLHPSIGAWYNVSSKVIPSQIQVWSENKLASNLNLSEILKHNSFYKIDFENQLGYYVDDSTKQIDINSRLELPVNSSVKFIESDNLDFSSSMMYKDMKEVASKSELTEALNNALSGYKLQVIEDSASITDENIIYFVI